MKGLLTLIAALVAASLQAGDIRTINYRTVDVQPIHDWKARQKTGDKKEKGAEDRPLKHWKDVKVLEIVQTLSSTMHIVKVEIEGTEHVITLRNMPKDLCAKVTRLQALTTQVGAAELGTSAAQAKAAAARMRAPDGYVVSGSEDFVKAVAAEEQKKVNQAAAASATAAMAESGLSAMKAEIAALKEQVAATTFLAMAIGTTYAGKPEWDTGLK